jgi:hypothetical protein
VLALFCLTWLQIAALPCVMAESATTAAGAMVHADGMPAMNGMSGEDCPYCPPAGHDHGDAATDHAACAFPHDPQVDARASSALALAMPAVAPVFVVALDDGVGRAVAPVGEPWTVPRTSLVVSYCRFLK